MAYLYYILTAVCAYIIGSSNMAFYISKIKNIDVKNTGSQNLGASNATMILGWRAGILTGLHDILKALLCVLLANLIFPDLPFIGAVAGVASVMGHIFPFYLKFNGGKGFASYIGMMVALNWKIGIIVLVVFVAVVLITNYMVAGTTTIVLAVPFALGIVSQSLILGMILSIASIVIVCKHFENYVRIYKGTEYPLRKAFTKNPSFEK